MKYLVTFCYDDSLMKKQCCENIIIWDFEIEKISRRILVTSVVS